MVVIEVYIAQAVLGFAVLGVVAWYGLKRLPNKAREDAHRTTTQVKALLVGTLGCALALVPALNFKAKSDIESLLDAYCQFEGEEIFSRVQNVDGLLIQPPRESNRRSFHLHSREMSQSAYLRPPERAYRFLEVERIAPDGAVSRYETVGGMPTRHAEPKARYALTWLDLSRTQESNAGLFGEQTVVYDRRTGEVLAKRTTYYSFARSRANSASRGILRTCSAVYDDSSERFPQDSYDFVSRVLIPPAYVEPTNPVVPDLGADSGFLIKDCGPDGPDLGRGLPPGSVSIFRNNVDLYVEAHEGGPKLICTHFFSDEGDGNKALRFADGTKITFSELATRISVEQ